MRKIFTIAALIALLAIPMMVVGAADTCPNDGGWTKIDVPSDIYQSGDTPPGYPHEGATEYCFKAGNRTFSSLQAWWDSGRALSHWAYFVPEPEPEPCDENDSTTRVLQSTDYGEWSDWVWDAGQQLFVRSRTVTEHWAAISDLDGRTICARGDVETEEVEPRGPRGEITLRQNCDGWGLMQEGQLIDSGTWDLPFELEVATSRFVDYRIFEGEECLKERGDVTLRIGGRCTEDGDSQEIGYVFDDGDFDGAKLRITRQDGVVVLEGAGEGSDFFPARAADYTWQIIWFNGETREVLDEGEFSVAKCDLPEPTPTPKPPPEHPPTGADPNTILPAVMSLGGFALMGIGGSILFMRRRGNS